MAPRVAFAGHLFAYVVIDNRFYIGGVIPLRPLIYARPLILGAAIFYCLKACATVQSGIAKQAYALAYHQIRKCSTLGKRAVSHICYFVAYNCAHKINVLIACGQTCKTVPKISSIYFFDPGAHTVGDGYLYQNRQLSDTFVFPNGKDGKVDSVYVDIDTTAVA